MCLPTHPPKGFCEIWENASWNSGRKRQFSRWFWGGWALFGNQPPYPPTFGKDLPKKTFFLDASPNADNSLIALISGAGCPGSGSAGVFMFWKFPEFVKCARRSRAHLTDSGNFQNIHIPVQWQERNVRCTLLCTENLSQIQSSFCTATKKVLIIGTGSL